MHRVSPVEPGPPLCDALARLFHAGAAFDAGHAQVNAAAQRFVDAIAAPFAMTDVERFCVTIVGDHIYVNGAAVEADAALQARIAWFLEFCHQRNVGQIHLRRGATVIHVASVANRVLSTQPDVGIQESIATRSFRVGPLRQDEEHEELVGHLTYASRFEVLCLYAEILANLHGGLGGTGRPAHGRLAARLISAYQSDPSGLLGLVCLRPLPSTVANRTLDTAILLVGMAHVLNFSRAHTHALVTTALRRRFINQEVAWWVRDPGQPYEAAKAAFRAPDALGIVTTFESAAPIGVTIPAEYYGHEVAPHVSTLLLRVAAGYVDLLQPGDASNPFSPETALQLMHAQSGSFFDADAVAALFQTLGLWPPGAVVRLNSGDVAVVVHRPRPGALPNRPFLRPVELSGGSATYDLSRPELAAYEIHGSAQRGDCAVNPMFVFLQ